MLLNPAERGKLREELQRDEGLRLKPYRCTAGKLTIGYGRNLEDKGISEEEAAHLLENDIDEVEQQLRRRLPWIERLTPTRQRVLINMAFNLGIGGLLTFRLTLAAIEAGHYTKAARQMRNSKWYRQVGARAERLADMMERGVDDE